MGGEMSSDDGVVRRERRDFDDFDELEDDEFGPDDQSELDVQHVADEDDAEDPGAAEEEEKETELEEERYGGRLQPDEW